MQNTNTTRNLIRIAIGVAIFLLLPLYLTLTGSGVDGQGFHWTPIDFVFAFVVLFGAAAMFEVVSKMMNNRTYKFAVGLGVAAGLLLVWINAAVGIIGGEGTPLFLAVPLTAFIGIIAARFRPSGMAKAMFATAVAQVLVPLLIVIFLRPSVEAGHGIVEVVRIIVLNLFFIGLWVSSGLLFRNASLEK